MEALSELLKQQIEQEAKSNASSYGCFPGSEEDENLQSAYITGATSYLTKLHHANEVNKALEETNRGLVEQNKEAINLLQEVFQKHESGLLPDRFVYEKIKVFLYPEIKPTTNEKRN